MGSKSHIGPRTLKLQLDHTSVLKTYKNFPLEESKNVLTFILSQIWPHGISELKQGTDLYCRANCANDKNKTKGFFSFFGKHDIYFSK